MKTDDLWASVIMVDGSDVMMVDRNSSIGQTLHFPLQHAVYQALCIKKIIVGGALELLGSTCYTTVPQLQPHLMCIDLDPLPGLKGGRGSGLIIGILMIGPLHA